MVLITADVVGMHPNAAFGRDFSVFWDMEAQIQQQRAELRREQEVYREFQPPTPPAVTRDLNSRLSRQREKQRQLQQHLRQLYPLSEGKPGAIRGQRFQSRQDRQRLYLKLQRRSWRLPGIASPRP
jgi:hypothetical protein